MRLKKIVNALDNLIYNVLINKKAFENNKKSIEARGMIVHRFAAKIFHLIILLKEEDDHSPEREQRLYAFSKKNSIVQKISPKLMSHHLITHSPKTFDKLFFSASNNMGHFVSKSQISIISSSY